MKQTKKNFLHAIENYNLIKSFNLASSFHGDDSSYDEVFFDIRIWQDSKVPVDESYEMLNFNSWSYKLKCLQHKTVNPVIYEKLYRIVSWKRLPACYIH